MENFLVDYGVYLGLGLLILEYILGKTTLVAPNSTLGLILDPLMKFLKNLLAKK